MPAPQYHMGFEGIAVCNGTDYNVTGWDMTDETAYQTTTSTRDYDPGTDRCYQSGIRGVSKWSGNFKFNYDSNNDPVPNIRSGAQGTMVLQKGGGHAITGTVQFNQLQFSNPGPDGLIAVTVPYDGIGFPTFT